MEEFREVDWNEVHERLLAVSLRMFAASRFADSERVLESYGVGFEDLAQEMIMKLHDPDEPKVTWNATVRGKATTKGVFIYLAAVLRNDFLDLVRAKRNKGQRSLYVPTEGDHVRLRVDPRDPDRLTDDSLTHNETHWSLRKRLDDDFVARPDDDLQFYVMLQFDGDRYVPYKPREAAEALGIDAKELYLLKDKFERRLRRLFKIEINAARAEERENSYEQEAR
ncbi:MAG: hypothetical protein ABI837_15425 [Acidobacteriota bacterium]